MEAERRVAAAAALSGGQQSTALKCTCTCLQGQRAVQNGRRELIASSRTLVLPELTANGRAGAWLTQRPELTQLAPSLERAMPEGERPHNSTVRLLPPCCCCMDSLAWTLSPAELAQCPALPHMC